MLIQFSVGLFFYLSISIVQTSPINIAENSYDSLLPDVLLAKITNNSEYSVIPANITCLTPRQKEYYVGLQLLAHLLLNFHEKTLDNKEEGVTRKCAIDGPCGILTTKSIEPLPEDDEDDVGYSINPVDKATRCICQKPQRTCSNGPLTKLEDGSEGFIFYCRNKNCEDHTTWLKKRWGDLKKNSLIHNFTQV